MLFLCNRPVTSSLVIAVFGLGGALGDHLLIPVVLLTSRKLLPPVIRKDCLTYCWGIIIRDCLIKLMSAHLLLLDLFIIAFSPAVASIVSEAAWRSPAVMSWTAECR